MRQWEMTKKQFKMQQIAQETELIHVKDESVKKLYIWMIFIKCSIKASNSINIMQIRYC